MSDFLKLANPLNRFIFSSNLYFGARMLTASILIYFHIDKGIDLETFNLLVIIFLVSQLLSDYPCGIIADYIGRHKSIYLSCIFWALYPLLLLTAPNIYGLSIGYFCYGLGVSLYEGAQQSILSSLSKLNNRSSTEVFQKIGKYNSLALFIFSSLGFLMFYQTESYLYTLVLQSFIFILSLVIFTTISYPEDHEENKRENLFSIFRKNQTYIMKNKSFFFVYIFIFSALFFVQIPIYLYWQVFIEYIANNAGIDSRKHIIFIAQIYFLLVGILQFGAHAIYQHKSKKSDVFIIRSASTIIVIFLVILVGSYMLHSIIYFEQIYYYLFIIICALITIQAFYNPVMQAINSLFTNQVPKNLTSSLLSFTNSAASFMQIFVLFLFTKILLNNESADFNIKNIVTFYSISIAFMFIVLYLTSRKVIRTKLKRKC